MKSHWSAIFLLATVLVLLPCCRETGPPRVRTVTVPMRDGIGLATDLYLPAGRSGPVPALLMRTPYNKDFLAEHGRFYSERGYAVAVQDVRGRYASEGEWEPFFHEGDDGYDSIEWLAAQDWCTGKVGMIGGSYAGTAQFLAAVRRPPHLAAIVPSITPAMPFHNIPYEGGVLQLGWAARWTDLMENARTGRQLRAKLQESITRDWTRALEPLPVIELDRLIAGRVVSYWRDWVRHSPPDGYWDPLKYLDQLSGLDLPVFLQSGWFDPGTRGTKLAYMALAKRQEPETRMLIGPWSHSDRSSRHVGGTDMGPAAEVDTFERTRRWLDGWLKDDAAGSGGQAPVQIYLMGANRWLEADSYPLPGTSFEPLYLHGGGDGEGGRVPPGRLAEEPPPEGAPPYGAYSYDPDDPTPSFHAFLKRRDLEGYSGLMAARDDHLDYETPPLQEDLILAGPLSATLYASTSARDTDWSVTVYGVDDAGRPYPIGLTFGILRARFRISMDEPVPVEPGSVHEYRIDLGHTAARIPAGHRLRMEVASASFPELSRNLNTGGSSGTESEGVVARQEIHHTAIHPSHLLLPRIPGGGGP